MQDPIVIVSAVRTPMAAFSGEFASLTAPQLGAAAIRAAVERAGLKPEQVEEVVFGCVLPAGQGSAGAPAEAWRGPAAVGGLHHGQQDVRLRHACGHERVRRPAGRLLRDRGGRRHGKHDHAPYLIPCGRGGYRIGHGMIYDHMMLDGLEDAYDKGRAMGTFGEDCAAKYGFTREQQDTFAIESVRRAQQATEAGDFRWEITPVTVSGKGGDTVIDTDEGPRRIKLDKIPSLAGLRQDGTITAASSSSINDGASALVMMRESTAARLGPVPLARMLGHTTHAQAPGWFTTAPVEAIAAVPQARLEHRQRRPVRDQRGLRGGADGGHARPGDPARQGQYPRRRLRAGPSDRCLGARIMTTLIGALRKTGGKRGVASLCIGGGEATAVGIELV